MSNYLILCFAIPLVTILSVIIVQMAVKSIIKKLKPVTSNKRFRDNDTINCHVVKVCDGDTIRVYHKSTFNRKKVSFLVRLYGIDAPEMAHFGMGEQPFAKESTALLKKKVLDKTVKITKLGTDHYGRCIGRVVMDGLDLSVFMVKNGMACVYVGTNAIYGESYNTFKNCEKKAKSKNMGMWKDGVELPMEYKKRMRKQIRKKKTVGTIADVLR